MNFPKNSTCPLGKLRTKITSPNRKIHEPQAIRHDFLCTLTWKNWPLLKITTKAEGCTESRSSCHRCITIYCIKALVQGLKGIAFHGNNEIIYMYLKSFIKPPPPLSNKPSPSNSPPPFSEKKGLVISPLPSPSIKQVQMGQVACLYHHEKGSGVLLCCFLLDGVQVHCSFSYSYALPYLFSGWSVEVKDFKFIDIFLLLK